MRARRWTGKTSPVSALRQVARSPLAADYKRHDDDRGGVMACWLPLGGEREVASVALCVAFGC